MIAQASWYKHADTKRLLELAVAAPIYIIVQSIICSYGLYRATAIGGIIGQCMEYTARGAAMLFLVLALYGVLLEQRAYFRLLKQRGGSSTSVSSLIGISIGVSFTTWGELGLVQGNLAYGFLAWIGALILLGTYILRHIQLHQTE